ncbi:hypothetical protein N8987_07440, partial [Crocinitomix sp.]|nr:hypothetical protein [Crocinitomix sp.]
TYSIAHDDCTAPEINLSANVLTTETASYNFVGNVSDIELAEQIQVKLNGAIKPFIFNPITGLLSAPLTLVEGTNTIEVIASGCETVSSSILVNYTRPCIPVAFSLVTPSTLTSVMDEETINVRLNTSNVNPETVSATINGESIPATISGGVIDITAIPLAEGSNSIAVTFGNDCSEEIVTYIVEHEHCTTPSIIINGLTDGMVITESEMVFFANIYDVDDTGDIVLKLNGVAVPFEFDPLAHLLQAPLTLVEGPNEIEIIIDGCELVTGGVDLVYDAPCAAPTYTLLSPTESSITVEGDTYTISVAVAHVTEDQISVKVNGGAVDFTYSSGTVIVVVPYISLPTNSVEITLTNDCGTETIDYLVTYIMEEEDCTPIVSATFAVDKKSVTASSNRDLMNVILNLSDGSTQLIEDVDGMSGTFSPTGEKAGLCIVGVWIRSGCNLSAAGEPFGDYVANPGWDGACVSRAPCSPITYSLVTPSRQSVTTKVSPYSIVLNATNIKNVSNIRALVNGVTKKVTYSGTRISLAGINLTKGLNTVQFILTNDCSTETITYTISYSPAAPDVIQINGGKDPNKIINNDSGGNDNGSDNSQNLKVQVVPLITPIAPATSKTTVKEQTISLKTGVKNVASKSNITMTVNGVRFTSFVYSSQIGQVSAAIRLNAGVNMIKIQADNGSKAELTYYITYQPPVQQKIEPEKAGGNDNKVNASISPVLQRITPNSSTASTTSSNYSFKLKAINVSSKSALTLNVNGANITSFNFSSSSKIMS